MVAGELKWVKLAEIWVSIVPRRGQFQIRAGAPTQIISHEAHMRYRKDVQAGLRLRRHVRILNIHNVEDVGARARHLICLCEEQMLAHVPQSEES